MVYLVLYALVFGPTLLLLTLASLLVFDYYRPYRNAKRPKRLLTTPELIARGPAHQEPAAPIYKPHAISAIDLIDWRAIASIALTASVIIATTVFIWDPATIDEYFPTLENATRVAVAMIAAAGLLASNLVCGSWWIEMHRRRVIHAEVYAFAIWSLNHIAWLLTVTFTHIDGAMPFNRALGIVLSIVAAIAVSLAIATAYSDHAGRARIICLFIALVAVAMFWSSHPLGVVDAALAVVAIGYWQSRILLSSHNQRGASSISASGEGKKIRFKEAINHMRGKAMHLSIIAAALMLCILFKQWGDNGTLNGESTVSALRWLFVSALSVMVYLAMRRWLGQSRSEAIAWASACGIAALAILTAPSLLAWARADAASNGYYLAGHVIAIQEAVIGMGAVCVLLILMWLDILKPLRPFLAALAFPMILLMTVDTSIISPETFQSDLVTWLELTIATIALFVMIGSVYGIAEHRQRSVRWQ